MSKTAEGALLLRLFQQGQLSLADTQSLLAALAPTSSPTAVSAEPVEVVSAKVSSQASLGMISALLAGFSLSALVEIEPREYTVSSLYVVSCSLTLGLSTLTMLESTLEYIFVMRELHHGVASAWALLEKMRASRRAAEVSFVASLLGSIVATGSIVLPRFEESVSQSSHIYIGSGFGRRVHTYAAAHGRDATNKEGAPSGVEPTNNTVQDRAQARAFQGGPLTTQCRPSVSECPATCRGARSVRWKTCIRPQAGHSRERRIIRRA